MLPTGAIRFAILKALPAKDLCFMVVVMGSSGQGMYSIETPKEWRVETIRAVKGTKYCDEAGVSPWPPPEVSELAVDGAGVIDFVPGQVGPCEVSIHAKLFFTAAAPWVPTQEAMDADGIPVEGGCF
jgi:hypothetical protein